MNMFIYYNNSKLIYKLIEKIFKKIPTIQFSGFSNQITKESISLCYEYQPQIIIGNKYTLNHLKKCLNFKYIPICIDSKNKYTFHILFYQLKQISENSKYSYKLNTINLRKKIYNELLNLKFNPNMVGTTYLLDCIICSYENPYSQLTHLSLEKYYKSIAIKYKTTSGSIKWNIQKAIENMYQSTSKNFRIKTYKTEEYLNCSSLLNHFQFLY